MDDRFSNPHFQDDGFPRGKILLWMGGLVFYASVAILLARNFAPELLDYIGGDTPFLQNYTWMVLIVSLIVFNIGRVMNGKAKKPSGIQLGSTAEMGQRDWNTSAPISNNSEIPTSVGSASDSVTAEEDAEEDEEEGDLEELEEDEEQPDYEDGETEDSLLELNEGWKSGKVVSDLKGTAIVLWFIAIIWNGMSMPAAYSITEQMWTEKKWGLLFIWLFPIIGLGVLFFAIRTTLQFFRFGKSEFLIDDRLGRVGGTLKGRIIASAQVRPTGDYQVKLACLEKITTGSGKNKDTTTKTVWEETKSFDRQSYNVTSGIPIEFQIPSHCPESFDDNTRGAISWQLSISAPLKGVDYEAQFEVPVFHSRVRKAVNA